MRILLTGATGFVGGHALQALIHERDRIGVDELRIAVRDRSRLPINAPRLEVHEGDLRDTTYVDRIVERIDVVVHAAAWTALAGQSAESRELYLEPTTNLFRRAERAGVARIVNVSTTSAAGRKYRSDPMSSGQLPRYWPHLQNVVRIENLLRQVSERGVVGVNLRFGLFVGPSSGLSFVEALVPRLRTRLVPWVAGGRTRLPLIAGPDIGVAVVLAATADDLNGFNGFNIIGPESPTAREVIEAVAEVAGAPAPWFSVPFWLANGFAEASTLFAAATRTNPLVTRSIIRLLEDTGATNDRAQTLLGYQPSSDWRQAIHDQVKGLPETSSRLTPLSVDPGPSTPR